MEELEFVPIFEKKSVYQTIRLYEDLRGKIILTLDSYVQFKEGIDEKSYHYALVDSAIEKYRKLFNKSPKDFVILGGGDGLAARNIFHEIPDANITLVDIDEDVINLCKTMPRMVKINKGSIDKCTVIFDDAARWIKSCDQNIDIIILDLPDPNSKELEVLYTNQFYLDIIERVNSGIISIQVHYDNIKKIQDKFNSFGLNTEIIYYIMPWLAPEGGTILLSYVNNL